MKKGKFRLLDDGKTLAFFCKGCKEYHGINIDASKNPHWSFNGDYNKPTFLPSIHKTTPHRTCHSYVTDGNIQYLSDSYHELAGQTIPLDDEEE